MTHTDYLYRAMQDFTNARAENRRVYMERKRQLSAYQGSEGYKKELDEAMKKRRDADSVAREKCKKTVSDALDMMQRDCEKRAMTPPTTEMVNLLTVARMLDKPSKATLDAVANSLGGNALALAALNDIAHNAWKDERESYYIPNYAARATNELTGEAVESAIRGLRRRCSEIMNSTGASRLRERTAKMNATHYGGEVDPDELPQEAPYDSERDFYKRELSVDYDLFAKAVNG